MKKHILTAQCGYSEVCVLAQVFTMADVTSIMHGRIDINTLVILTDELDAIHPMGKVDDLSTRAARRRAAYAEGLCFADLAGKLHSMHSVQRTTASHTHNAGDSL